MFCNLDSPPDDPLRLVHHYVDYVELLTVVQDEDGLSFDDVVSRLDMKESQVNDFFEMLLYRSETYNEKYPFIVRGHSNIKLKENLTDIQLVYVFLLLCSMSSKLNNPSSLRRDFELLSKTAFANYLPKNSECYIFGKSGLTVDRYKGLLKDKLIQLAKDLKVSVRFKEQKFAPQDTGDGGIDIVAWIPFQGDELYRYIQIYFCQCATGRDWYKKQAEPEKMKNYLELVDGFHSAIFIPYDGRDCDNSHIDEHQITSPLFYDRLRIINLLSDGSFIRELGSFSSHVCPSVDYIEDIV